MLGIIPLVTKLLQNTAYTHDHHFFLILFYTRSTDSALLKVSSDLLVAECWSSPPSQPSPYRIHWRLLTQLTTPSSLSHRHILS